MLEWISEKLQVFIKILSVAFQLCGMQRDKYNKFIDSLPVKKNPPE